MKNWITSIRPNRTVVLDLDGKEIMATSSAEEMIDELVAIVVKDRIVAKQLEEKITGQVVPWARNVERVVQMLLDDNGDRAMLGDGHVEELEDILAKLKEQ